jgi:hypothetical protein
MGGITEQVLKTPKTTPKGGMTHHLAVSSGQLAAGAVDSDSIWEMSAWMFESRLSSTEKGRPNG